MKLVLPTASGRTSESNRSAVRRDPAERGIALVITLILLSVTLVMALAFLALGRREREAVATGTDTTQARLAADSALAAAQSQLIANIFATSNAYNFGLFVSTNYLNPYGFDALLNHGTNLNVSYFDSVSGQFLTGDKLAQNVANLQILPRVPVFLPGTNGDFRYFLDLNRNGRFDTNGFIAEWITNSSGVDVTNGNFVFAVGDPEWVGILERPDMTHSPLNKFTSRYAFIAMPVDNALDLNAIHNQALTPSLNYTFNPLNPGDDTYFRNQGVGTWEMNLAAFLTDLNTNQWDSLAGGIYQYRRPAYANTGAAFYDAFGLLNYRYAGNYNLLASATRTFGNNALQVFPYDNIDEYGDGPIQTNLANINEALYSLAADGDIKPATTPWPGADNTNHFYSLVSDLFDATKVPASFISRLTQSGNATATYDRYTFYRMLAQLGTDSSVNSGKLNLNYVNVGADGSVVPGLETNLYRWTNSLAFFTNAADRMLRLYSTNWFQSAPSNFLTAYYGVTTNYVYADGYGLTNYPYFGVTNQIPAFGITAIPVYVNGQFVYASSVNRLLQLAANIYDASTNSFYPSVFRPMFSLDNNGYGANLFISGYTNVILTGGAGDTQLNIPVTVESLVATASRPYRNQLVNVYGVPWIIGAKKNMPNFNQLAMLNQVQVTRKIQVKKLSSGGFATNQMYVLSFTNSIRGNLWNSYASAYPRPVDYYVWDDLQMSLYDPSSGRILQQEITNRLANAGFTWSGYNPALPSGSLVPFGWDVAFLSLPIVYFGSTGGTAYYDSANPESPGLYDQDNYLNSLPQFILSTTNNFRSFILDGNHLLDYVQLRGPISARNLGTELTGPDDADATGLGLWRSGTAGAINQVKLNMGSYLPNQVPDIDGGLNAWTTANPPGQSGLSTPPGQQAYFAAYFQPAGSPATAYMTSYGQATAVNNSTDPQHTPYNPTRTIYSYDVWQANDPLVHYLARDLYYTGPNNNSLGSRNFSKMGTGLDTSVLKPAWNMSIINSRYQPWGSAMSQMTGLAGVITNSFDSSFIDPLAKGSDYWDFPTNVYPTVGWLGRVHRGTPWQTVYLKATNLFNKSGGFSTWTNWTGNLHSYDAYNSMPVQDRQLFDVFTTQLNDNAARGALSVNQTSLSAWSALFSGMVAMTNMTVNPKTTPLTNAPLVIDPAGVDRQNTGLWQIYNSINATRGLFGGGTFAHVGDVLATPALSDQSPFLNRGLFSVFPGSAPTYSQTAYGISDEMYEWLPQQAMSLMRVSTTPRYVIYGYGQALRPAQNSTYSGGGSLFGLVTNYQVMAESAVRAVVQVHPQVTALTNGYYVTNYTTTVESYDILPPN